MFFSLSAPSLIGLDIQPDSIRLVQLKPVRNRFMAERIAYAALPAGVFDYGKITRWDLISAALSALVEAADIKGHAAAINLPANLVRMQRIQLPSELTEEEVEAEIHAHMQRDLPGMTDPLCMDFRIAPTRNTAYMDVFFAAARQDYLSQYRECVNAAGLRTKIVDIDIYALKRAAHFALQLDRLEEETNALVSVVSDSASLIVFNAQDIIFHQQWEVSDKADFLGQLKNRMQVCLTAFQHLHIRKLFLCAARGYLNTLLDDLTPAWAFQVCCPNPFEQIELADTIDTSLVQSRPADFLVACGSAMRRAPLW